MVRPVCAASASDSDIAAADVKTANTAPKRRSNGYQFKSKHVYTISGRHHHLLFDDKALAETTICAQHLDTGKRSAAKTHEGAGIRRIRLPADTKVMAPPTIGTLTLLHPFFHGWRRGSPALWQTTGHVHALPFKGAP